MKPYGIGVATGEMCQNRVIFKQLLQANGISYCQIDACRLGGVPEVLAVYLMAKKFNSKNLTSLTKIHSVQIIIFSKKFYIEFIDNKI